MKTHSNFVSVLRNFRSVPTSSNGQKKTQRKITENDLPQGCQLCRLRVSSANSQWLLEKVMLQKLTDVESRLSEIQEKYASLQEERERELAQLNEFRLIAFATKESDMPAAVHAFSIDSWERDSLINYMNLLQKRFEQVVLHLQKTNSKVEIATRAKEISTETRTRALTQVKNEELEKRRKIIYKNEAKMVASLRESAGCKALAKSNNISIDEAVRLYTKNMGILIPEDFWA